MRARKMKGGVLVRVVETTPQTQTNEAFLRAAQHSRLKMPVTDAHATGGATPCRVCGGPVPPNAEYWDRWRQHQECAPLAAAPAARLMEVVRLLRAGVVGVANHSETAHDVGLVDAPLVRHRVALYMEEHLEPTYTGAPLAPWSHIDMNSLVAALADLPARRVEAGLVPTECTDGPCAWCGVRVAQGWTTHGHQWLDGSPAPLCGTCSPIYQRHGCPAATYWDDEQRSAIAEALTGTPGLMGEIPPRGLRAYAETALESDGRPWGHLPGDAVDAYRWDSWGRFEGAYAPPEHRAEAVARAEARSAARRAASAAAEAQRASRADVYGFEEFQ